VRPGASHGFCRHGSAGTTGAADAKISMLPRLTETTPSQRNTMKKIMTAVFASALALTLAAPAALACDGHKTAQEKDESGVIAKEDKAAEEKKAPEAEKKARPKVAKAEKKQQKKPVRVSQK
jgi:hypothetical protein